jgi:hypothetical protein
MEEREQKTRLKIKLGRHKMVKGKAISITGRGGP